MKGIVILTRGDLGELGELLTRMRYVVPLEVVVTGPEKLRETVDALRGRGIDDVVVIGSGDATHPSDVVIEDISEEIQSLYISRVLLHGLSLVADNPLGRIMKSIIALTGDPQLALSLRFNFNLEDAAGILRNSGSIAVDDLRMLSFIDVRNLGPRIRITHSQDPSYMAVENSVVIIGTHLSAVNRLVELVEKGKRPSMIIATAPAVDQAEAHVKENALKLGIPSIITRGTRGGPHVGGVILDTLLLM